MFKSIKSNGIRQQTHPIFTSLYMKVKMNILNIYTTQNIERLQMKKEKKRGIPIPVWKEKVRLHILYVFFHEYLEKVFCCCKYTKYALF